MKDDTDINDLIMQIEIIIVKYKEFRLQHSVYKDTFFYTRPSHTLT